MELLLFFLFLLVCFAVLVITNTGGKSLTGRATVVSRRVEVGKFSGGSWRGNRWNYLVTFRLSDGEEIELYTFENYYKELKEGLTGQLTWCKDSLGSFEPEMEDIL